jgi:hypothetical protein
MWSAASRQNAVLQSLFGRVWAPLAPWTQASRTEARIGLVAWCAVHVVARQAALDHPQTNYSCSSTLQQGWPTATIERQLAGLRRTAARHHSSCTRLFRCQKARIRPTGRCTKPRGLTAHDQVLRPALVQRLCCESHSARAPVAATPDSQCAPRSRKADAVASSEGASVFSRLYERARSIPRARPSTPSILPTRPTRRPCVRQTLEGIQQLDDSTQDSSTAR